MNLDTLQASVYAALIADGSLMGLIEGVYNEGEQPDDAGADVDFAYVTIGKDTGSASDTKTTFGTEAIVQIDAWVRERNFIEVKRVTQAVKDVLHREPLIIAGASHVFTIRETAAFTTDDDGLTKRGLSLFRINFTLN